MTESHIIAPRSKCHNVDPARLISQRIHGWAADAAATDALFVCMYATPRDAMPRHAEPIVLY